MHPSHLDDRARWVLEMAGVAPDWVDYYYATQDAQENSWDEWDQRASERAHASAADLECDRADQYGSRASADANERVVMAAVGGAYGASSPSQFDVRTPTRVDGMTVL